MADVALCQAPTDAEVGLVVTAGYLRKIGPETLRVFEERIINIHPALLARFGGPGMFERVVHEAVIASGDPVSGPSVHYVAAEYDTGPVIASEEVPVEDGDPVETLSARVLRTEHRLLPAVVRRLALTTSAV